MVVNLKIPGKKLEHHGIKIEFVGQIGEMFFLIILLITRQAVLESLGKKTIQNC